jgi:phosphatidylserine synthase
MILSNKVYDILKWVAIIAMPAFATLVKVVFTIWGLPYGTEIATTITALATCLGALLMISNANYQKTLDENIEE